MNSNTDANANVQKVIRTIEQATQSVVVQGLQNGTLTPAILSNTMREGADAFEREVGRPMSYAEMRAAFG
jgi:hypothetical protein